MSRHSRCLPPGTPATGLRSALPSICGEVGLQSFTTVQIWYRAQSQNVLHENDHRLKFFKKKQPQSQNLGPCECGVTSNSEGNLSVQKGSSLETWTSRPPAGHHSSGKENAFLFCAAPSPIKSTKDDFFYSSFSRDDVPSRGPSLRAGCTHIKYSRRLDPVGLSH